MCPCYDVHFSLEGFFCIVTDNKNSAELIASEMLREPAEALERMIHTGVGIEIGDIIKREEE